MELNIKREYVRERLRQWGSWSRVILTRGLGFSSKSMIGKICDSKGLVIKGTADSVAPQNKLAEEIDSLIEELRLFLPKSAKILGIHYVYEGSIKNKVKKAKIPRATYFYYLDIAENWLMGHLN
ncbi:MAG: hypothetical protein A3E87_10710 [Gammaproteobacteria bacterium RIFCSPHIGHO2_12_FULL_35_23]|nr:MAG: hypothetical protein A3E87_10710 [Gammaproteobacteria bacterium RIFCSPHIGHO2_12_FULL_35_23]